MGCQGGAKFGRYGGAGGVVQRSGEFVVVDEEDFFGIVHYNLV